MQAPVTERRAHHVVHHGKRVDDPYAWLRDPGYPVVADPAILAHLAAENAHFDAAMAPFAGLVDTLFEELKARQKQDDASVPVRDGDWDYWWAFEPGGEYRRWWRRAASGGDAMLLLDEPAEAEGKAFFRLGALAVSPDGTRLAWSADTSGGERFTLRVRDLATGIDGAAITEQTMGEPVWGADGNGLAWVEVNAEWRPFRVRLHRFDGVEDVAIHEEADPSFFVGIARTQDREQLVIAAADHVTSEARLVPTADLSAIPRLVSPRQTGREYQVDAAHDRLFIRVNDAHLNFRIVTAPIDRPEAWEPMIEGSDAVYIRGLTAFAEHLVLTERVDGLDQIRLVAHAGGGEHRIALPEASYAVSLGANPAFAPAAYRLAYTSMVTPPTTFDYHPAERRLETLKVQEVPSGYDAALYVTRRSHARADDGTLVPVSIVHRRDRAQPGPLHLYGYGAYGMAMPPAFSASRLSLLDRGFAYAIAHVRGGDDLGYRWYLDGKLEKRTNSFTDFVAVARHLVDEGLADAGGISISGGSAGGTLVGAALNLAPQLFRAAVAHVPFVDVLSTMLDASLPLTPIEWPEWGDPLRDPAAFARLLGYSPYDNVRAADYPPILATAGLNDPRVTYWEPAKWVARLRERKTDANAVLFKINMGAGHGGKSGRWQSLRETAEEYAFVLASFCLAEGDAERI